MRIIRILMALALFWAIFASKQVLAAEAADTNETQIKNVIASLAPNESKLSSEGSLAIIKFEIQDNITLKDGFVTDKAMAPYNYPGYEPVQNSDEVKRATILAKYEARLATANFPEGKFAISATAYTAAADECGNSRGITASGVKVKENQTLACPPQFPFGAKIQIDGMGTFVCEDRGGAIKGNHFDIYMQTKSQAFAFGHRTLLAEVVN